MNHETPHLDRLRERGDGYKRPDSAFFSQLAERAEAQARMPARRRPIWLTMVAVAASLLLLLGLWYGSPVASTGDELQADSLEAEIDQLINALTDEEIYAYIEANTEDFEEELLLTAEEASSTN